MSIYGSFILVLNWPHDNVNLLTLFHNSIAMELMKEAELFFLDEPTSGIFFAHYVVSLWIIISLTNHVFYTHHYYQIIIITGLDSASSLLVVTCLHFLASKGVTVCASIHQPRTEIFNLMDRLLLLAPGLK